MKDPDQSQGEEWFFVDTGPDSGEHNMQFDEELARLLIAGEIKPTLRLYRWHPRAISLGYHQRIEDIDVKNALAHDIDVVRRPTGGRAILHAEELTYSVVMLAPDDSVHGAYNVISKALVRGLSLMGAEVSLVKTQPNFVHEYRQPSSIPCFASSARNEIEWRGRKLVGSAQRRYDAHVVLQHGSILCGHAHRRLADYLRVNNHDVHAAIVRDLAERTTDLREIIDEEVDPETLSGFVKRGFELEHGINFSPFPLTLINLSTNVQA